jgi:hypothetical protein
MNLPVGRRELKIEIKIENFKLQIENLFTDIPDKDSPINHVDHPVVV